MFLLIITKEERGGEVSMYAALSIKVSIYIIQLT